MAKTSDPAKVKASEPSSLDAQRVYVRPMSIGRGLYSLRYIGCDDPRTPPRITVHAAPDTSGCIVATYGPNSADGVLRKFGNVAIISSTEDASIVITIFADARTVGDGVNLKLDQLDRITDATSSIGANPVTAYTDAKKTRDVNSTADLAPVMLAGHMERRGDVSADHADWLGAPTSRLRLEGFSVLWPHRPIGVDILYSCNVAEIGATPEVLTGGYAGTRGRALPIYSIDFKLVGENAAQYELEMEAAFFDGSVVGPVKAPAEIKASTERSPLVGLRLIARELNSKSNESTALPISGRSSLGVKASDLRVYRSIRSNSRREKSSVI